MYSERVNIQNIVGENENVTYLFLCRNHQTSIYFAFLDIFQNYTIYFGKWIIHKSFYHSFVEILFEIMLLIYHLLGIKCLVDFGFSESIYSQRS